MKLIRQGFHSWEGIMVLGWSPASMSSDAFFWVWV